MHRLIKSYSNIRKYLYAYNIPLIKRVCACVYILFCVSLKPFEAHYSSQSWASPWHVTIRNEISSSKRRESKQFLAVVQGKQVIPEFPRLWGGTKQRRSNQVAFSFIHGRGWLVQHSPPFCSAWDPRRCAGCCLIIWLKQLLRSCPCRIVTCWGWDLSSFIGFFLQAVA